LIRNIINIIIVALLLLSSSGVIVNKHYSNGKLYSVSLYTDAKSCCKTECKCCNNETEIHILKADYITSNFEFSNQEIEKDLIFNINNSVDFFSNQHYYLYLNSYKKTPPLIYYSKKTALLQTFRC
jgi:hypothetical protein